MRYPGRFVSFFNVNGSLLQRACRHFTHVIPRRGVVISARLSCSSFMHRRVPRLPVRRVLHRPTRQNATPDVTFTTCRVHALGPGTGVMVTPSSRLVLSRSGFTNSILHTLRCISRRGTLIAMNVQPARPRAHCKCVRVRSSTIGNFTGVGAFARGPRCSFTQLFMRDKRFF